MNTLDIIYIVAIIVALIAGYMGGFLKRISFTVGAIFGLFNATVLHDVAGNLLCKATGWNEIIAIIVAFVAIVLITAITVRSVVALLAFLLEKMNLGIIYNLAGALTAVFMTVIIATALIDVSSLIVPDNEYTGEKAQNESFLYNNIVKKLYKDTLTKLL